MLTGGFPGPLGVSDRLSRSASKTSLCEAALYGVDSRSTPEEILRVPDDVYRGGGSRGGDVAGRGGGPGEHSWPPGL